MAQNSKDAQKRTSRAERRAAEAAALKARAEQMEKERKQQTDIGGQVAGEPPRLFNIYPQGNFIEATVDTPYFQIGEAKYGKPIIDRVVNFQTPLKEASKCVLISFDSTIRSNLSVGLPIDLMLYRRDGFQVTSKQRIGESDPYYQMIRQTWSQGLRETFARLADPDWAS